MSVKQCRWRVFESISELDSVLVSEDRESPIFDCSGDNCSEHDDFSKVVQFRVRLRIVRKIQAPETVAVVILLSLLESCEKRTANGRSSAKIGQRDPALICGGPSCPLPPSSSCTTEDRSGQKSSLTPVRKIYATPGFEHDDDDSLPDEAFTLSAGRSVVSEVGRTSAWRGAR